MEQPDRERSSTPHLLEDVLANLDDLEWTVFVGAEINGVGSDSVVATGSVDVDEQAASVSSIEPRGDFDRYNIDDSSDEETERVLATDGEILLMGTSDWVESTLDQHDADDTPYLDEQSGARELLAAVGIDGLGVLVDGQSLLESEFEDQNIDGTTVPEMIAAELVQTDSTRQYTVAAWYPDSVSDSEVETVEAFFSAQFTSLEGEPELRQDDRIVLLESSESHTPPEQRPDVADYPRFSEYDAATNEVLFEFTDGEHLPVERFTIEIEGETYDGDWARGQDEIGEGDTVAIAADAIEPGDELTVSYEDPDGGSGGASGSTVLNHLPFAIEFDPDDGDATIQYEDGPPLDTDRLRVLVGEDDMVYRPWNGTLTEGDSTTITNLPVDADLRIEYERTDGETLRLTGAPLDPPGVFEVEYDAESETVTVRYPEIPSGRMGDYRRVNRTPDQQPLDASRYEITIDGELADRQWTDAGAEIVPGDTLEIQNVSFGTSVSVAWVSEDGHRHEMDTTYTRPEIAFGFDHDETTKTLTVRHVEGPTVDASNLDVRIPKRGRTVDWSGTSTVSKGDEFVVDDVESDGHAIVTYGDRPVDGGRIPVSSPTPVE